MPGRLLPMSLPTKFLQVHVYVNAYCIVIVKNIGPMQETCGLKGVKVDGGQGKAVR